MANTHKTQKKNVDSECINYTLAKAIKDGDIVNFRFLFLPYSPLRIDSTEDIDSIKYSYLLPTEEEIQTPEFQKALTLIQREDIQQHIQHELNKNGPAQLHSELLLLLADNAVRQGKYTSASQAYELLRIRHRMQELFFDRGKQELLNGNIPKAVKSFIIASYLEYDYGAFPEPLPAVPKYQEQALILHAEYKYNWEECIGYLPLESFLRTAFQYLFLLPEHIIPLVQSPVELQIEFLVELILELDPQWSKFVQKIEKTIPLTVEFYQELANRKQQIEQGVLWQDEWDEGLDIEKYQSISATLLGRELNNKEWWAYLKELAYEHPASPLFVARQLISKDKEVIIPRYRNDNIVVKKLQLPELPTFT